MSASHKTRLFSPQISDDLVGVPPRSHECNKEPSGATSFERDSSLHIPWALVQFGGLVLACSASFLSTLFNVRAEQVPNKPPNWPSAIKRAKPVQIGVPTFFPPKIQASAPARARTGLNEAAALLLSSREGDILGHFRSKSDQGKASLQSGEPFEQSANQA